VHLKNALTRALFNWLCPDGAMVANSGLVAQIAHHNPLVCYGVAESVSNLQQDWKAPRLQLLFSGTLLEEVGSQLLLATLSILREQRPSLVNDLHFIVTGKGPFGEAFRSFSTLAPEWLSYGESLPREIYLEKLRSSHIGLSLRLASFEMGKTTFPSKVVEYAQHGLILLTTRASDVPFLFGETALYLEEETPEALLFLLDSLLERRNELHKIAIVGRERVASTCSPEVVGQALKHLLFSGTSL
jgi:glycosyltransferase involved in cell wall biosynthesis